MTVGAGAGMAGFILVRRAMLDERSRNVEETKTLITNEVEARREIQEVCRNAGVDPEPMLARFEQELESRDLKHAFDSALEVLRKLLS